MQTFVLAHGCHLMDISGMENLVRVIMNYTFLIELNSPVLF